MSNQMYMVVDIDRCWGCKACQVSCKREHGLAPEDFKPTEVFRLENDDNGMVRCDFLPVFCQHCDDPACMPACPKNAITCTEEGLIAVDEEKCIGCGLCFKACPYGAIGSKLAAGKKKAVKCDLCPERRARGLLPSCEQHCIGGAFTSCTQEQKDSVLKDYPYKWGCGRVIYVSRTVWGLGMQLEK